MDDTAMPNSGGLFSPAMGDMLIVLGVIILVTLAALFWALMFHQRKSSHRRRRQHHHHHHKSGPADEPSKAVSGFKQLLDRHRRHRRERRALNPTLAETGGLPPVREEEPPSKP